MHCLRGSNSVVCCVRDSRPRLIANGRLDASLGIPVAAERAWVTPRIALRPRT